MQKVQVKVSKKRNDRTSIPNIFIDQYMKDANGDFVKVYLYLLRSTNADDSAVTVSEIADLLNLTEKDIIRALKYWVKAKVLDVTFDESGSVPQSITFLNLEDSEEAPVVTKVSTSAAPSEEEHPINRRSTDRAINKRSISAARISEIKKQEESKYLFDIVEGYLGHPLNDTELRTIGYIYDFLGFSTEMVDYLVEYCVSNDGANMRYIETVANAWADRGIHTVAEAKETARIRNKNVSAVTKAFGITGRTITNQEMDFINRWYKEYHFDSELVEEACKRTVMNLGRGNFAYAEKILKDWYESGVHSMDAVASHDAKHKSAKSVAPATTTAATATGTFRSNTPAPTANKFNNFTQRTYNFEEMERSILNHTGKSQS